ncbi:S26 family signal peptidase (plasmid) [Aeromonas media]|uniref:S26 family signal peptidase n=1 Tax=Aeromonas caviae TaxID=648 RepID=A0A7D5YQ02_AERCA|nr:S26 family signal peptidase [Aeromonas caviae]QLI60492.1 S26 family signal peptidase [Aeromonas caviae]QYK83537.1 S26 family signal peptidase [Aeromonas media]
MTKQHYLLAGTLCAAAIMSTLPSYLVMPISSSVRPSLLIKLSGVTPKKGDYVTFELHNDKLKGGHAFLTKRVGCVAGDTLENRAGAFFCNGDFMVIALDKDGYGRALSQFIFNGIIPANKAFMVGDNPNSYDSRYWGLTPLDNAVYSFPIF